MAAVITWSINTTEFTVNVDGTPNRITTAHWQCTAEEGGATTSAQGVIGVDLDAATATEADTVAAAQAALDANESEANVADIEATLQADLDEVNSTTTGIGLPWEQQHPVWLSGTAYAVDDFVNHNGLIYKCIQAHTSEPGWTPNVTPALWSVVQDPNNPQPVWVPGEQVNINDVRWYPDVGTTQYTCIQAHTTQVGWEPPNVPALWEAL